MSISIQNPIATFNLAVAKNTKFQFVRAFAQAQAKIVTKSEDKVKEIMREFQKDIHSGSTGGLNVRI